MTKEIRYLLSDGTIDRVIYQGDGSTEDVARVLEAEGIRRPKLVKAVVLASDEPPSGVMAIEDEYGCRVEKSWQPATTDEASAAYQAAGLTLDDPLLIR